MKLYLLIFSITLLTSCYSIYVPTVPNVSSFNNKYEGHVEVAVRDPDFQLTTSFSVSNHICLQYNSQFHNNRYNELGIGIFNFYNKKTFNQFTFGLGKGKTDYANLMNGESSVFNWAKGFYNRFYFQFYSSFNRNEKNLWGIAIRYSLTDFTITDTDSNFSSRIGKKYNVDYFEPYITYSSKIFNELAFSMFMGFLINNRDIIHSDLKVVDPQAGISLIILINNKSNQVRSIF